MKGKVKNSEVFKKNLSSSIAITVLGGAVFVGTTLNVQFNPNINISSPGEMLKNNEEVKRIYKDYQVEKIDDVIGLYSNNKISYNEVFDVVEEMGRKTHFEEWLQNNRRLHSDIEKTLQDYQDKEKLATAAGIANGIGIALGLTSTISSAFATYINYKKYKDAKDEENEM